MNYIKEIKAFYYWLELNPLPTGAIALWHALMAVNNMAAWAEEFTVANIVLQSKTGLSRQGLDKARNLLKQKGLIEYKKGTGNKAGTYKMNSVCQIVGTTVDTEVDTNVVTQLTQSESLSRHSSSTLNKHKLKHKQKEDDVDDVLVLGAECQKVGTTVDTADDTLKKVTMLFEQSGMGNINATIAELLQYISDNHPYELIEEAFRIARLNHATSIRYVEKILIAWKEKGIRSLEQLRVYEKNKKGGGQSAKTQGNSWGNDEQYEGIGISL